MTSLSQILMKRQQVPLCCFPKGSSCAFVRGLPCQHLGNCQYCSSIGHRCFVCCDSSFPAANETWVNLVLAGCRFGIVSVLVRPLYDLFFYLQGAVNSWHACCKFLLTAGKNLHLQPQFFTVVESCHSELHGIFKRSLITLSLVNC